MQENNAEAPFEGYTPTDKAPEVELGPAPIPVARYSDPAYLDAEDRLLWCKTWLLAGAACDVASPGDYFVFEVMSESILVVRAEDGEVRAVPRDLDTFNDRRTDARVA